MGIVREPDTTSAETLIGRQGAGSRPVELVRHDQPLGHTPDAWGIVPDPSKDGGPLNPIDSSSKNYIWDGSSPLTVQLSDGSAIASLWIPGATNTATVAIYAGAGQGVPLATTAQTGPVVAIPPGHTAVTLVSSAPFAQPCLVTASGETQQPSSSNVNANVSGNVDIGTMPAINVAGGQQIGRPSDYPMGATPWSGNIALTAITTTGFQMATFTPGHAGVNIYFSQLALFGFTFQEIEWMIFITGAVAPVLSYQGNGDFNNTFAPPIILGSTTGSGAVNIHIQAITMPTFNPARVDTNVAGYYL